MKQTYITPKFINDLMNSKLILGFRVHFIYSQEYPSDTHMESSDYYIKQVPESTKYTCSQRTIAETVNLDNNNEKLMVSINVPTLKYENYIVYTYLPFYKLSLTSNDYSDGSSDSPTIENLLRETNYIGENRNVAFVFKWDDENEMNTLTQLSNSSLKLFIDLTPYRVYSNIISITHNEILHSHEFRITEPNYSYDLLDIQNMANIGNTNYNGQVVPGYEYYRYKELTESPMDFPYESFINDIDNKNNNGGGDL